MTSKARKRSIRQKTNGSFVDFHVDWTASGPLLALGHGKGGLRGRVRGRRRQKK